MKTNTLFTHDTRIDDLRGLVLQYMTDALATDSVVRRSHQLRAFQQTVRACGYTSTEVKQIWQELTL